MRLFAHGDFGSSATSHFYKWLADDKHREEKDAAMERLWDETAFTFANISQKQTNDAYAQLCATVGIGQQNNGMDIPADAIDRRRIKAVRWLRFWQSAAAVFVIVIGMLGYMLYNADTQGSDLLQSHTPVAQTRQMVLPDGTVVMLNSCSALIYPDHFNGHTRSVYLMGEASFKVAHDKEHPFIVKTNDMQVTALGTEFNVSAYPDDHNVESTLIEGIVKVDCNDMHSSVILKPGQMMAYNRDTHKYEVMTPNIADITAWQRGEVALKEKTLAQIFSILERKYPYSFHYSMHRIGNDRYTLHFPDNAPIKDVMDVIVRVTGKHAYRIDGDNCYFYNK